MQGKGGIISMHMVQIVLAFTLTLFESENMRRRDRLF